MRLLITLTLLCSTAPLTAQTGAAHSSSAHRAGSRAPASAPLDPKAAEGIAAVGTMPAATGPSAPLFTLRYVDLRIGTGELERTSSPGAIVFYTVHYTGWLPNGTKFDSSVDRNQPFVFPVGARQVITAWDTGFEGMRVGGKRRLIVPYQLGYGAPGHPPDIPEKSDLIFDVELLGMGNTPTPVTGSAPTEAGNSSQTQPSAQPASRPEEHPE